MDDVDIDKLIRVNRNTAGEMRQHLEELVDRLIMLADRLLEPQAEADGTSQLNGDTPPEGRNRQRD